MSDIEREWRSISEITALLQGAEERAAVHEGRNAIFGEIRFEIWRLLENKVHPFRKMCQPPTKTRDYDG